MRNWASTAALALILALTVGATLIHGRLSNRWGQRPDLARAAEALAQVPKQFADWETSEDGQFDDSIVSMLECAGHISRKYVNRQTGDSVHIAILLGPPGPISAHTPEVCYPARALEVYVPAERIETQKRPAARAADEYWRMVFRSRDLAADYMEVWYAWSVGDQWTAPPAPRVVYGGEPMLWKIQVATPLQPEASSLENNVCRRFLEEFVPLIENVVVRPEQVATSG